MSKLVLSAALLAVGAITASSCGPNGAIGRTSTTAGNVPRPEAMPPPTHTTDNGGFIDNGGRASGDEANRPETAGMRSSELGMERPTGTPGAGFPLPIEPSPPRAVSGEGAGSATSETGYVGPQPSGGPEVEAMPRIARARCDHDTVCNRVGRGRLWESQDACVREQREVARDELAAAACPRGLDQTQLGCAWWRYGSRPATKRRGTSISSRSAD